MAYDMDVNIPPVLEGVHITKIVRANELDFPRNDGFDSRVIGELYNAVTEICNENDDLNP
jgi:hypothetical protein